MLRIRSASRAVLRAALCPALLPLALLQPPLADAESVRDAVIARLFEDLGKQGLDAHHPFAAFGGDDDGGGGGSAAKDKGKQPVGRLRSMLSIGKGKGPKVGSGACRGVLWRGDAC